MSFMDHKKELKTGWSTGACATAAAKAAFTALLAGKFPDPVEITLPRGHKPSFALALKEAGPDYAAKYRLACKPCGRALRPA